MAFLTCWMTWRDRIRTGKWLALVCFDVLCFSLLSRPFFFTFLAVQAFLIDSGALYVVRLLEGWAPCCRGGASMSCAKDLREEDKEINLWRCCNAGLTGLESLHLLIQPGGRGCDWLHAPHDEFVKWWRGSSGHRRYFKIFASLMLQVSECSALEEQDTVVISAWKNFRQSQQL